MHVWNEEVALSTVCCACFLPLNVTLLWSTILIAGHVSIFACLANGFAEPFLQDETKSLEERRAVYMYFGKDQLFQREHNRGGISQFPDDVSILCKNNITLEVRTGDSKTERRRAFFLITLP